MIDKSVSYVCIMEEIFEEYKRYFDIFYLDDFSGMLRVLWMALRNIFMQRKIYINKNNNNYVKKLIDLVNM